MRILFTVFIFFSSLVFTSAAQANCFWEVAGRIEGFRPAVGAFQSRSWPAANLEVRVQARWAGNFPWNQTNWPATRTDSAGEFAICSVGAFADGDCQRDRDFRVEVKSFETGYVWRRVHQQFVGGPSGFQGLFIPAPVHTRRIGDLILHDDGRSENGVIRVEGLYEPDVDLQPVRDEEEEQDLTPHAEEDPTIQPDGEGEDRTPQAVEDPCAMRHSSFATGVELRFGQMTSTLPAMSPDSALRVERRSNTNGVTLNRLRNHIIVENAGSRDFHHDPRCPALVQLRFNEGPGRRNNGWSNPSTVELPSVAVNASVIVERNSNLLGAGDVLVGEWAQQWSDGASDDSFYEYVLIEAVLDPTNVVQEAAEGDNQVTHCYHAPQNAFVAMSNCQSKQ